MKKDSEHIYFPIMIDLTSLPCLVVGGGNVALRKVQSLLEFGGRVTVVSPRIGGELAALAAQGRISILRKPYSAECIKGNKIVFCATNNPGTNKAVSEDCARAGILLNAADNPALCNFIMPAILRRGPLTVSISTQGKAPFFTKAMKKKIARFLTPSAAGVTRLAAEFRRRLISNGSPKSRVAKEKAYDKFLSTDWDSILARHGEKKSHRYLEEILKETEDL